MGYTTDFIGHIDIHPRLTIAEQQYLLAFAASRRFNRAGGPYEVPGNPAADHDERPADLDMYNTPAPGQPSLWCGWQPCWDGCCLSFDGREKFYGATEWLGYLIDHFWPRRRRLRTPVWPASPTSGSTTSSTASSRPAGETPVSCT